MNSSSKIEDKMRKAAKGLREPIVGEMPSDKILKELKGERKKGSCFLCC